MSLRFYQGEENGVIVEKNGYSSSLFSKQYVQALAAIYNTYGILCKIESNAIMDSDISNIVAFCGDRGEGKTSCMKSVVSLMKSLDSEEADIKKMLDNAGSTGDNFKNNKWLILDSIDPALFDSKHNVLEIVLGLLYAKYQDVREEELDTEHSTHYHNVAESFRKVRKRLHHLMDELPMMYDMLDEMDNLSAAIDLRKEIAALFLNMKQLTDTSAIIIVIDDIDLNMTRAYMMSEQVRTFLNNQYCIVLMSCRIEQLQMVISNSLKEQMKFSGNPEEIESMAVKYVTKFLPIGNRINMPKVYDIAGEELELFENRSSAKPLLPRGEVKMVIMELIFRKTRFLFYNSQGGVSPIIPNNLRNLRHLFGMLLQMPDFENNKLHSENKRIFKHYFLYTWTRSFDTNIQAFIEKLNSSQNTIALNKNVVSFLAQRIGKESIPDDEIIQKILNQNNYVFNVSVGDVFYLLQYLEQSSTDSQMQQLIFFLKSYYSILLYEKYDMLTEGNDNLINDKKTAAIYKTDALFGKTSELQKLLNGSYFTYRPEDLMPADNEYGVRDLKVIRAAYLQSIAKSLKDRMDAYDSNNMSDSAKSAFEKDFKILEFFALTVKRSVLQKYQATYMHVDRTSLSPQHIEGFDGNAKYLVFDALSIFANILNVKMAYNRFKVVDEDCMYEFAKKHDWTLLRSMAEAVRKKECNEQGLIYSPMNDLSEWPLAEHRLLSNATIRNGEVLTAILDQIKNKRYSYRSYKGKGGFLAQFYRNLILSDMNTYDKSDGKPYEMKFAFLNAVIETLSDVDDDNFSSIYEYVNKKRTRKQATSTIDSTMSSNELVTE